jgi:putative tricarboxylic transport membrane protein
MIMKNRDLIGSLFWAAVGGVFCVGALKYRLFKGVIPGAGFLPFLAGVILIALSLVVFVSAVRARRTSGDKAPDKRFFPHPESWKKVSLALAALLGYWVALEYLGFLITTFLFLLFLLRVIEPQKWLPAVSTAFIATTFTYALFNLWLKVQLPKGLWGI